MKRIITNSISTRAKVETIPWNDIIDCINTTISVYSNTIGSKFSAEDREDLSQDCIIKVQKYWSKYDPDKSSVKTWVSTITRNAMKDAVIRHSKRNALFTHPAVDEDKDGYCSSIFDRIPGGYEADHKVEDVESMRIVDKAINSLNVNYQFILRLYIETGMKPSKMAEILGCSADVVATTLCRARKALKMRLGLAT